MTVLGVDLGDRRIGLAVSDPHGLVAVGAGAVAVRSEDEAIAAVAAAAREREVDEIVIGIPITMRGTKGPRAAKTERFAGRLRKVVAVPVSLWDERLTTVEATRALRSIGRSADRSGRVDQAAATLLLQSWLDAQRGGRGGASGAAGPDRGEPNREG